MTSSLDKLAACKFALDNVNGKYVALLLYGSHARGDQRPDSDIDVLQISSHPAKSYRVGRASFSVYIQDYLLRLAAEGDLFALHLKLDASTISGSAVYLQQIQAAFRQRETYESLRTELQQIANLLDVNKDEYAKHWVGLERLCKYVLRTHLYSRLADNGTPSFSMSKVAETLNDDRVFQCHIEEVTGPDYLRFLHLRSLYEEYSNYRPENVYGSIEAAVVNAFPSHPKLVSLGLRTLSNTEVELPYSSFSASSSTK